MRTNYAILLVAVSTIDWETYNAYIYESDTLPEANYIINNGHGHWWKGNIQDYIILRKARLPANHIGFSMYGDRIHQGKNEKDAITMSKLTKRWKEYYLEATEYGYSKW